MALKVWIDSSFQRYFPASPSRTMKKLEIDAALNEKFSFQVLTRLENEPRQKVKWRVEAPKGWNARLRRVGYVPVRHLNTPIINDPLEMDGLGRVPGYVPDPLFEEDELLVPESETHAFWISIQPKAKVKPGKYNIKAILTPEKGRKREVIATVQVHPIALEKRREFRITNWFYIDSLMDWYKTEGFDKRFWEILTNYLKNLVEHGQDVIYTPVFTPPLDGVKRPSQLLRVSRISANKYKFDWSDVKKFVRLAKRLGFTHFEWCHLFTQWGAKNAIRIYEGQGETERLLWPAETSATSSVYRSFLKQYLGELQKFLKDEKIISKSFFHVSDEPHGEKDLESYLKACGTLRDLAPWMKLMDALSDIRYAKSGAPDIPIPSIRTALKFHESEIPSWCYYCCSPREGFLNRLLDTPLAKIAMHGFVFYRWPFKGFLHWGQNYWYHSQTRDLLDPFSEQDGGAWSGCWAYGDTFMVYPGVEAPIDSIRWEIFAESLQDYQLLQTLGIARNSPILAKIKSFESFPKNADWRKMTRKKLFKLAPTRKE